MVVDVGCIVWLCVLVSVAWFVLVSVGLVSGVCFLGNNIMLL